MKHDKMMRISGRRIRRHVGVIIFILAFFARPKVHPDYLSGDRNEEMMAGLI